MKKALPPWAVPLLAIAWLAATAWWRPLAVPDEGRYVGVAWRMVTSGDWLLPQLNGLPYFHKPPLFYWIAAGAMALFGPHEWAARLAPLAGAALGCTALYLFTRRSFGEREARLALLALATQPLLFAGAQYANLDMLVAGCIAASTLAFAHAALLDPHEGRRARRALAAGYLFAALGVLAKGLIGLVLPGMVLVGWLVLAGQWRRLRALAWLPGIALFLLVVAPWFLAMQARFPEFAHYFFVVQHVARFASGDFNNQQPAYFYLVVLGLGALPWSLWMLAGARRRALAEPERGPLRLLMWVWLVVVLGFFSLTASKLVGYILPATFPLALLAADSYLQRGAGRATTLWRTGAAVAVAACIAAVSLFALRTPGSNLALSRVLRDHLQPGDQVVFFQAYYFDIPFNARLRTPVVVVDDWDDPSVFQRDNWRKELADAGRFDPRSAREMLRTPAQLPQVYCNAATTWVVGGLMPVRYTQEEGGSMVAAHGGLTLWRVPGLRRANCPGRPSANSGDTS